MVGPDLSAGGPAWIAGAAWAGDRSVARVEVSVDGGGSWMTVRLERPVSRLAWARWALRWIPPAPGVYRIACRAVDGDGRVQEAAERPPHPSGASGYHELEAEVH